MARDDEPSIGMDLGTTNSVVGFVDPHGRPIVLPNAEGDNLTPSVVYFEPGGPAIVGKEAFKAGLMDPDNMVEASKREMGKEVFPRPIRGKYLPPAAIVGVILHRLVEDAANRAGEFKRAVITVPAYFNEPRRKATVDAARMAGLEEVELLNEPTAAALAFGHEMGVFAEKGKIDSAKTKTPGQYTLLVYDLGGGTFDVTLMRIKDQTFEALVCDGDVQLGGRDWDERVLHHICEKFVAETGVDPRNSAEALAQFRAEAEDAKKSLSQRTKTVLRLACEGARQSLDFSRHELEQLTADLLGRTRLTCELALREAKLRWDDLDAVLLVGGSSRMPAVREMITELSGQEPSRAVSPDEAVAMGAALYARMLWGEEKSRRLEEAVGRKYRSAKIRDINSHSLGIVGIDKQTGDRRVATIIPRNTPIPHSNSRVFRIRRPGQSKIYIQIVEGESEDPDECAVIGECRLIDLPKDLPLNWPVTVSFAYRRDGRIFVEAEIKGAAPFQVEIDRKRKIDPREAEDWANELIGGYDDEDELAEKPKSKRKELPPSHVKTARVKMKEDPDKPAPPVRALKQKPKPAEDDDADDANAESPYG
jgi:molecular chaperone DnaK